MPKLTEGPVSISIVSICDKEATIRQKAKVVDVDDGAIGQACR